CLVEAYPAPVVAVRDALEGLAREDARPESAKALLRSGQAARELQVQLDHHLGLFVGVLGIGETQALPPLRAARVVERVGDHAAAETLPRLQVGRAGPLQGRG